MIQLLRVVPTHTNILHEYIVNDRISHFLWYANTNGHMKRNIFFSYYAFQKKITFIFAMQLENTGMQIYSM